jgi:hypothetical protein
MDEQRNEFETDDSANPTDAAPGPTDKARAPAGREMLIQLQQMIDTIALQAGPVLRDVAAKAAELSAVAAERAGPLAYKAADITDSLSKKVAERSKAAAADWRRPKEDEDSGDGDAMSSESVEPTNEDGRTE